MKINGRRHPAQRNRLPGLLSGFALCAALAATGPGWAEEGSMRCGGHLITGEDIEGPTMEEVLKVCGEPSAREGDVWIYDEPGKPKRVLHFDGGRLQRIEG